MYKLTDIMIQNFENDLKEFHGLFRGGRCEAWQLEELIIKAIKSDHSKSESVAWIGRGHDVDKDVRIIEKDGKVNDIQIKSGKIEKSNMIVSAHRTGRFEGDLSKIKEFLNSNKYDTFLIPYCEEADERGKRFVYQIFYAEANIFKIDNDWEPKISKKGTETFFTQNSKGVKMSLRPSMSWQIWYEIPLNILTSFTREIIL
ncbi:MAG: hypothetical protein I3273_03415 [Candidatus Moeniiplasma glomeromycotorum]|nr:hypothetical protein [Candidatus Moeniiplasma glomeromycotorum]MCE8167750.1 hypothetical protein [Candidatus Moeniiplasma glomeromycotorum]MCE8169150.1 hypothetical protein [Candidatus Moeniiplasma glomeromycotorum]